VEWRRSGGLIYGITNIRDYQEQVDMIEGDLAVLMDNTGIRSYKKLKGIIIFSDNLLPRYSQQFYYDFSVTGKPSDEFLRLLGGER
ncbi:MAG: hypothetical protein ACP5QK_13180, partial [Myxococcota bacterium]